jgi:hypothetical protein
MAFLSDDTTREWMPKMFVAARLLSGNVEQAESSIAEGHIEARRG